MASREMVELFAEELTLCSVMPGETVAVLSEGKELRDYAEAFLDAADGLGAETIDLNLVARRNWIPTRSWNSSGSTS